MESKKKRILITGASGFIGSHLVRIAQEQGWEVTVAVRPTTKTKQSGDIHSIVLDYADEALMVENLSACRRDDGARVWDYIVHNAGLTKTPNLQDFYEANAENTRRFCSAIIKAGVEPTRFFYMSSLSTYSQDGAQDGVIRITDEQKPTTEYGRSKLLAEFYVRDSGLKYTMILPTGVYGSGEYDYLMAIKGIKGGLNFMAGSTPQALTFVHGEDVARAVCFLLEDGRAVDNRYIISDGDVYTDIEFSNLVKELLGVKTVVNLRTPMPILWCICQLGGLWSRLTNRATPLNPDKYPLMKQRSWRCDVAPLMALGWKPRYRLREGLEEAIDWGRKQGLL